MRRHHRGAALILPLSPLVVLAPSPEMAVLVAALAAFGHLSWQITLGALVVDLFPKPLLGTVFGLVAAGSGLGGMLPSNRSWIDCRSMAPRRLAAICYALLAAPAAAQQPALTFSTYLGLADCDGIAAWQGDVYLACHSPEDRLPIEVRGLRPARNVMGAFVLRLNPKTGKLIYATRVGGGDFGNAVRIKVDRQGFAYAAGFTKSPDFPSSPDAVQRQLGGDSDAFLIKVAPNGQIIYATLLGGGGTDQGDSLELDGKGGVFVGGTTWSSDFPGQRRSKEAREGDAFVSYLRPGDPDSLRSILFGGMRDEKLTGLVADRRGGLLAVGYTKSADFPLVAPLQATLRGTSDLFFTRLNMPDMALTFSTFFGGSGDDSGWGIAVDGEGNPVVAGITDSSDLPASADAFQRSAQGGLDAFVARFQGPGYRSVRLTYYGGTMDDSSGYDGDDIKVDSAGNVWLVGLTSSRDLPMRRSIQPAYGGGEADGFLAAFSPTLANLHYATYRGGADRDILEGLDISIDGVVFATGLTFSKDLPMPARCVQRKLSPVTVAGRIVNTTVFGLQSRQPGR